VRPRSSLRLNVTVFYAESVASWHGSGIDRFFRSSHAAKSALLPLGSQSNAHHFSATCLSPAWRVKIRQAARREPTAERVCDRIMRVDGITFPGKGFSVRGSNMVTGLTRQRISDFLSALRLWAIAQNLC
jgi:hypothetical protein